MLPRSYASPPLALDIRPYRIGGPSLCHPLTKNPYLQPQTYLNKQMAIEQINQYLYDGRRSTKTAAESEINRGKASPAPNNPTRANNPSQLPK